MLLILALSIYTKKLREDNFNFQDTEGLSKVIGRMIKKIA